MDSRTNPTVECQSYQKDERPGATAVAAAAAAANVSRKDNEPLQINDDLSVEDIRISNNHVLGIAFYSFLGFTIMQTTFAIKAKSSAMIADSAAMFVDSATYLFNMIAERLKNRELSREEMEIPVAVLEHKLKLQRNYLELIPPFISVTTLLYVTVVTFDASIYTLTHSEQANSSASQDDEPNVTVMMVFSFLNLLLDILNVTCFARVNQAIFVPPSLNFESSSNHPQHHNSTTSDNKVAEDSPLLVSSNIDETLGSTTLETSLCEDEMSESEMMNLNMCSAWTHVFADTLRSVAVLVAGALSFFTNLISPTFADASAALVVSLVIFMSCVPLVKGMAKTLHEIILMRQSPLMAYWKNTSSSSSTSLEDKNKFEVLV